MKSNGREPNNQLTGGYWQAKSPPTKPGSRRPGDLKQASFEGAIALTYDWSLAALPHLDNGKLVCFDFVLPDFWSDLVHRRTCTVNRYGHGHIDHVKLINRFHA